MRAYTAGPTNATRRLESPPPDPKVHVREHRGGILATTATADATATANTTANATAGAKPIRSTDEGCRERCYGERDALACRAAPTVGEIGSARCTIEAVLTGGDAAKPRPCLLRVELVMGTIAGSVCFIMRLPV
jgi:hypothetical protein